MKIFKGFAQIGPLTDNTEGAVAPIGEISSMALTFTREKTMHTHSDFPGDTLIGFSYSDEGVPGSTPDSVAYQCLTAINWTYTQARSGALTNQKDSFQQAFIQNFGSTFDLIDSGMMKAFGNYWAPEYIEIAPYQQSSTIKWKIWFSNEAFYNQFDDFLIKVIPPVTTIDSFFGDYNATKTLLATVNMVDVLSRVETAKENYPYTVLRADRFDWTDKIDKTLQLPTEFTTIIYGLAGDNLDARKEAIRSYIMSVTTHTRDEWAEIFPDLFTSTEFILTPMWNQYSISSTARTLGLYSGNVSLQDAMAMCHKTCKGVGYTDAFIDSVLSIFPTQYKSVMIGAVGGPENRGGIDTFAECFPDYMNVYTTHIDFQWMSETTREFVMLLAQMLEAAEVLTPDTSIPRGFNRLIRDGVVYVATSFNEYLWLVTTKYSVDAAAAA